MSLSSSVTLSGFFVEHSATPGVAEFKSYQYTLLTRGEDIRRQPGIRISDTLNNSPNTCSFTVDGSAPAPLCGEKIEILDSHDGNRRLFAGNILSVEQIYEGQIDQIAWQVNCSDFTWLFNRRRPFGQWINTSVSVVVRDIVARFAPGFTVNHVQTNLAKVSVTLDGSKDLVTVFNELAAAIGGGHWYIDYDMDVHFFHVVPAGLLVPIGPVQPLFDHLTVALGARIAKCYEYGYYLFRHSFLYSNGSESQLQAVSNFIKSDGEHQLIFSTLPLGVNRSSEVTCIGRRIYYNKFVRDFPGGDLIEKIRGFCQVNDNVTTGFTTNFGATGASVASVVTFGAFAQTYSTPLISTPVNQGRPGALPNWVQLSDQAASLNIAGGTSNGVYGNPYATLSPPTSAGTVIRGGAIPSGWTPGSTLYYAYTYTNLLGETTMGTQGQLVLNEGVRFLAPLGQPPGAPHFASGDTFHLSLFISDDNVEFHDIAAGLLPGEGATFMTPRATWVTFPSAPTINDAHIYIPRGWAGWDGTNFIGEGAWLQPVSGGNIVYFATSDVAQALENAVENAQNPSGIPKLAFSGHLPGPASAPAGQVDTVYGNYVWNGGAVQFKTAYVYRDGSVSYPSPPSATILKRSIKGQGVAGYQLQNILAGPAVNGNEVIARFIYCAAGLQKNPNFSINYEVPIGFEWPQPFLDPTWAPSTVQGIIIIPDNVATTLSNFTRGGLDYPSLASGLKAGDPNYLGAFVGYGNVPYGNAKDTVVSLDPIPIWPNPDGPSLEDVDPPGDIDDDNEDLLHADSGSTPFTVSVDHSQIRNRVTVVGSGSVVTKTANVGDTSVSVADVTAFSPNGGTVFYNDSGTGEIIQFRYLGVQGVVGDTSITLETVLTSNIPQGVSIANYFVAEDLESQKYLAKVELDKAGKVTDGVHEFAIVDTSLKAVFQLFMRAYAELELFSKPLVTVRYATRDPKSRSGQIVHVNLTSPPCVGDFLIQSVSIDQIHDESDELMPRYTVEASSSKFDLNDLLLRIIGGDLNRSGAGNSTAGIVPAGGGGTSTATGLPNPTIGLKKFSAGAYGKGPSFTTLNIGIVAGYTSSGSSLAQNDAYPGIGGICSNWIRYVPVNLNGNLCGLFSVATVAWDLLPKFIARFRTGSKLFNVQPPSGHRAYWVGIGVAASTALNGGSPIYTNPHVALLCVDPGDNGGQWEISSFTRNGNTQQRTNLGFAPMLPQTHYEVTIQAGPTSGTVTVMDLTRNLVYSVSVPALNYMAADIPGTSADEFVAFVFGSGTLNIAELIAGAGGIDIGAVYLEVN